MDFEQIDELAGMEMKTPGAEESETCPICGGVNALPQAVGNTQIQWRH